MCEIFGCSVITSSLFAFAWKSPTTTTFARVLGIIWVCCWCLKVRMKVVYLIAGNSKTPGHHLGSIIDFIDPSDHHLSLWNIACALNLLHADHYGFVKQSLKAGLALKTCHATRYASRQAGWRSNRSKSAKMQVTCELRPSLNSNISNDITSRPLLKLFD